MILQFVIGPLFLYHPESC